MLLTLSLLSSPFDSIFITLIVSLSVRYYIIDLFSESISSLMNMASFLNGVLGWEGVAYNTVYQPCVNNSILALVSFLAMYVFNYVMLKKHSELSL